MKVTTKDLSARETQVVSPVKIENLLKRMLNTPTSPNKLEKHDKPEAARTRPENPNPTRKSA